ncbi:MAG: DUF2490 domain-containing protein [Bacteroidales bacterium]|nr:DUF2490 domain-containing protein [Bacteroidales bacterium]
MKLQNKYSFTIIKERIKTAFLLWENSIFQFSQKNYSLVNLKVSAFLLVFLLSSIFPHQMFSQEDDFQIWGDVSAKYKINKKFRLSMEMGLRTRENSTLMKQSYAELGGRYKLSKRFNIALKYRFTDYQELSKISVQRVNFDAAYNKKLSRIRLTLRMRYQYEWLSKNYVNELDEQTLRSRLTISYDIKKSKIEPFFAFEHYFDLNGDYMGLTTKLRYTLGADMPMTNWSDISVAYRIEPEYNQVNPLTSYIFILSWIISLN